jgi:signal transduction histidine kinase
MGVRPMQDVFAVLKPDEDSFLPLLQSMAKELEDSSYLLYQLLAAMPGSFVLLSATGKVLAVSPRMAEVFLRRDDAVGIDYRQLSFPIFKDCAADPFICDLIRSTIEEGLEYENVLLDKPGEDGNICLELSLRILRDSSQRPMSILLQCVENVVQFNFLRHQQLRGQKLEKLGTLSAGMIHEIKNPLQAISGIVQLLQKIYSDDARLMQKFDTIRTEINRMNVILTEFLSFAAAGPDKMELHDPNRLCREVLGIVEGNCKMEGIELRVELFDDMPELMLDGSKIKQVLINLLVNAIDALKIKIESDGADFGPRILLKSEYDFELDECVIVISDNGFGITPEVLKALNQPFFTTKKHGTGLGVSLSRSIVEEHGGRLLLQPGPNGGTNAKIILPELAGLLALTQSLPTGGVKPLIIDRGLDILNTSYEDLAAADEKVETDKED